jgi:hypothetical protein
VPLGVSVTLGEPLALSEFGDTDTAGDSDSVGVASSLSDTVVDAAARDDECVGVRLAVPTGVRSLQRFKGQHVIAAAVGVGFVLHMT